MIKDRIENSSKYYNLSESIKAGLEWLKNSDLDLVADGKYYINSTDYINVQTYTTKDDALFEAHRKYIDIQYMIKGSEKIGISDLENCKTAEKYDSVKDIEFFTSNSESYETLNDGEFLILYPQDAHKPSLDNDIKCVVKKAVVKIKI